MKNDEAAQLVARVRNDLAAAMKQRDQAAVAALKSLLASFSNAEAVQAVHKVSEDQGIIAGAGHGVGSTEAARKQLSMHDLLTIIDTEMDELKHTIASLDASSEYQAELKKQLAVLERYR